MSLGISRSNAYNIQKHSCTVGPSTAGRKPLLTHTERSNLVSHVLQFSLDSFELIASWARNKFKKAVTIKHVGEALHAFGFNSRIAATFISLKPDQIANRLIYARQFVD
jgi:hypothetical protein